MRQWKTKL